MFEGTLKAKHENMVLPGNYKCTSLIHFLKKKILILTVQQIYMSV